MAERWPMRAVSCPTRRWPDRCSGRSRADGMSAHSLPGGPLKGVKVIELGTLIAGPFCSRILAEFGAEVIKIESPDGGDPLRTWRKLHEGTSLWWLAQARNKKSVAIDLKAPEGQALVRRLAREADVV